MQFEALKLESEKFNEAQIEEKEDVEVEESTVMEGFRYRVNREFPVLKKQELLDSFPRIPPGMLSIWRSEDEFNF